MDLLSNNLSSLRANMLSYFQSAYYVPKFLETPGIKCLPPITYRIVNEISSAKVIPFELALLGFLPSVAAADRGRTRVEMSDGTSNPLSLLIHIGADASTGKSCALEDSVSIFHEWEQIKEEKINILNNTTEEHNSMIREKIRALRVRYNRTLSESDLKEIIFLKSELVKETPSVGILLNDVTDAAYSQYIIENNYAIRLESDGELLPKKLLRKVTKAWSGEGFGRNRLTTAQGRVDDPFIVDLVMTQPDYFSTYIRNPDYLQSGLMSRTLIYRYPCEWIAYAERRKMQDSIVNEFRDKLFALLNASDNDGEKTPKRRIIKLTADAEQHLQQFRIKWSQDACYGRLLYRAKDFVARMPQHAIRLAGCFYLAEYPAEDEEPISLSIMQMATSLCEFFLYQVLRWALNDYSHVNVECCRAIMLHVLEKNFNFVPETEIKQALRHRFKAADVNVSLYYLLSENHLQEFHPVVVGPVKRGRPEGRQFMNPYYDPNGVAF